MPLSGNKGEWSEVYVFLKLLADGKLNIADANLNAIQNFYYPILEVLRIENDENRKFKIDGTIRIIDDQTNRELLNLQIAEFVTQSELLLANLKAATGRSFSFPVIEDFLDRIGIHSLAATKTDKSDIKVIVHDFNTGLNPLLGFSIKSMLGEHSTLLNPGTTTNFIYEVTNIELDASDISIINQIQDKPKIKRRIEYLISRGAALKYCGIQSENFELNLRLVDSDLPEIIGNLVLNKYSLGISRTRILVEKITRENPKDFNQIYGHPFYEYKIKNFLTDAALGMTPATLWKGVYDATGGIIIVKKTGDLVCYHIYNRTDFQNYLLNNTKLEQADTDRYGFGRLYEENGRLFLKLNLQVRFC